MSQFPTKNNSQQEKLPVVDYKSLVPRTSFACFFSFFLFFVSQFPTKKQFPKTKNYLWQIINFLLRKPALFVLEGEDLHSHHLFPDLEILSYQVETHTWPFQIGKKYPIYQNSQKFTKVFHTKNYVETHTCPFQIGKKNDPIDQNFQKNTKIEQKFSTKKRHTTVLSKLTKVYQN